MASGAFSFMALDELFQAQLLGDSSYVSRNLISSQILTIGPLVEYTFQARRLRSMLPQIGDLDKTPPVEAMIAAYRNNRMAQTSLTPRHVEFSLMPSDGDTFKNPRWVAYQKRFEGACHLAGFAKPLARAITSAFGEMADNVVTHSERLATGLTGYRWSQREFEYVVADAGIGVLASLCSCPDYSHVRDHARALFTALQPNESRFGRGTGHGTGFNYVFTSLMNLHGSLRFRSGDQVVSFDGRDPEVASVQMRQCPPSYQGFFVSVECRLENS